MIHTRWTRLDHRAPWAGATSHSIAEDTAEHPAQTLYVLLDTGLRRVAVLPRTRQQRLNRHRAGNVRAFLNQNGGYPVAAQNLGSGWDNTRTRFADLDGDGKNEIIALDADGTIRAFPNVNGMNGFPFAGPLVVGKVSVDKTRVRFADLDGDGRADLVTLNEDGRVRAYRNLYGLGTMMGQATAFDSTPVIVKVTDLAPDRILFGDIDGDHKAELATIVGDTVRVYRNRNGLGYGTYDGSQEVGWGFAAGRTHFADLTADGKAELLLVKPDGTVWSFTNAGSPNPNGSPFGSGGQVGSGWHEPARVFFG